MPLTAKDLQKFDLDEKEAKAYLAILELGDGALGRIVQKSGIKRTTLYDVIDSLKSKGLVSISKREKKTVYIAEDPRVLREHLEEKKQRLEKLLPELLSIANAIDKKPNTRYFEGLEGIKDVYKDTLRFPDQELLAWVSDEAVQAFDEEFLNEYYLPRRVAKKIWVRAIAPDRPYMQGYQGLDEKSLRRTKLASPEQFPIQVEINLYGKNRIAVMAFSEQIGLIIESEKIATTLKSVFEMNWLALR
jgi:sugar-specific transcriptional regulator TrmB